MIALTVGYDNPRGIKKKKKKKKKMQTETVANYC